MVLWIGNLSKVHTEAIWNTINYESAFLFPTRKSYENWIWIKMDFKELNDIAHSDSIHVNGKGRKWNVWRHCVRGVDRDQMVCCCVSHCVSWPGWGDHWRLGQDGGQWEPVSAWCSPDMECTGPHTVTTLAMAPHLNHQWQLLSAFVKELKISNHFNINFFKLHRSNLLKQILKVHLTWLTSEKSK